MYIVCIVYIKMIKKYEFWTVMKNPKEQVKVLQHIKMLAFATTDIPIHFFVLAIGNFTAHVQLKSVGKTNNRRTCLL